jgi:hypothetical protein
LRLPGHTASLWSSLLERESQALTPSKEMKKAAKATRRITELSPTVGQPIRGA